MNQNYILNPDKTIEDTIKDFSKNNLFEVAEYKLLVLGS